MIGQYVIVGLLVVIAGVYTVVKFSRVWKGKDSSCSSCKGCDLQRVKTETEKKDCSGPTDES